MIPSFFPTIDDENIRNSKTLGKLHSIRKMRKTAVISLQFLLTHRNHTISQVIYSIRRTKRQRRCCSSNDIDTYQRKRKALTALSEVKCSAYD
ncbi:hypothetical protein JTE90_023421 [Oedothorax gibbosus]|uniref:Uncharacterized protein n=1 Tax=Oedothorax gibbosus TaxID=931172 RepID=A0AAV6U1X7_9ARAC|nr:hypothetical protein JTE90_023421 [Oedothorax gibbosus]